MLQRNNFIFLRMYMMTQNIPLYILWKYIIEYIIFSIMFT